MELVNLTPHPIVLKAADGTRTTIPTSGTVARVSATPGAVRTIPGIPVPVADAAQFGELVGLPESSPHSCACGDVSGWHLGECHHCGTAIGPARLYIVSALVAAACRGRDDVVSPGTGPGDNCIRDEQGRVIAVTRLVRA